jgi:hypothetical protein
VCSSSRISYPTPWDANIRSIENPAPDSNHTNPPPVPAEAPPTTFAVDAVWPDFGYDGSDPFGFNNISDAWFGQQLPNLDWLEIPQF